MLDGSIGLNEHTDETVRVLRHHYESRMVSGESVPKGMEVQGVDVVDLSKPLISHQSAMRKELEAVAKTGATPCIVIFRPTNKRLSNNRSNFNQNADLNRYVVVTPAQANNLLGNNPRNQGLRNSLNRRVKLKNDIETCAKHCVPASKLKLS